MDRADHTAKAAPGPVTIKLSGPSTAALHLASAISAALGSANPAQVAGVVGGFAGLDGPGDYAAVTAFMTEAMESVGVVAPWWAVNDGVVAWAGALGLQPGAIVVSGSGAIAFAVNASGESAHSDGLGHWLGDEGSGFDIGQRGLRAAMPRIGKSRSGHAAERTDAASARRG